MDTKIKKLLERNGVRYRLLVHRTVYTAFNAAETQHLKTGGVAKVVLVKLAKPLTLLLDGGEMPAAELLLVAVPAGKRVDLKKISRAVAERSLKAYKMTVKQNPKAKKPPVASVKLASEKDITARLKTKVGLLHPFGPLWNLPVLVDRGLTRNPKIVVSAGSYTESLELKTKDHLKLTPHLLGSFA